MLLQYNLFCYIYLDIIKLVLFLRLYVVLCFSIFVVFCTNLSSTSARPFHNYTQWYTRVYACIYCPYCAVYFLLCVTHFSLTESRQTGNVD